MQVMQDNATTDAAARRFFERISERREVWSLQTPDGGWVTCPSHEAEGKRVMLFWSDRAYAARCACAEWADCAPTVIPFEAFVKVWLPGMTEDGFLVGPNWDGNLCGIELTANDAAGRLAINFPGLSSVR